MSTLRRSGVGGQVGFGGYGCWGLTRPSFSPQNPRSSSARVDNEERVDGDDGWVGGVSGRTEATARYIFASEYIFVSRLRFAARRR